MSCTETLACESAVLGPWGRVIGVDLHGQKCEQQWVSNQVRKSGEPCPTCAHEEGVLSTCSAVLCQADGRRCAD